MKENILHQSTHSSDISDFMENNVLEKLHMNYAKGDLLQQYCAALWRIPDSHPWLTPTWPQATGHMFGTLPTIDEGCSLC